MVKEYKLIIEAAGEGEREATENAIRMLNLGASFDEITCLDDLIERPQIG